MTTVITYCSKMLRNIGSTSRLVTNYALFGLETVVRSKIINLCIKRRRNLRPYRCSRGGRTIFRKIHAFVCNQSDRKCLHFNITGINWANLTPVSMSSTRTNSQKEIIAHFATINCCSIVNKTADFKIDLHTQNVDICALTETWLKEDDAITPMEMCPAGYASLSVPQTDRSGDGLALVFRKDLDIKQSTVYKFSSMECTDFSVKLPGLSINLAVIYRPPDRSVLQFAMDILEYMEMNVNTTGNIILTGDLNIKMNNSDDPDMNTFSDLLDSFDLVNHVSFPTHRSMNTLDLVITHGDTNFVRNPSQGRLFLDHNIVHFQVVTTKQPSDFKVCKYRKLKNIVRENFQKDITKSVEQLDLENLGPADCLHAYNNIMQTALDKRAPIKTKKISSNKKRVPWFNSEISTAIRDWRRAEHK